jgi:hypothetical protein
MIDDEARDHDMNHHKDMNDRQPSAASRRRKRLAACRRSASGGRAAASSAAAEPGSRVRADTATPVRPGEKAETGTDLATLKAAALKAVPGGTVYRVETDADGATYEAHMTKADGGHVTVKFGKNFAVTAVQDGMGAGGFAGGMGHGGPGGSAGGTPPTSSGEGV